MKKAYFIIIATLFVLGSFWAIDSVQGDNILWKLSGGTLAPVNGTWPVSTTQYCLGNSCITVWPSGGGGGSSTWIYQGFGITATPNPINNTGTIALNTSTLYNAFSIINCLTYNTSTGQFGSTCVATNTGNWAGLWQNRTSSDFLPSSTVYIPSYDVRSTNPFFSSATTTTSTALTFSSSSLNLGSASTRAIADFLASTTVVNTPSTTIPVTYVATLNGSSGTYNLYVLGPFLSIATGTGSSTISFSSSSLNLGSASTRATSDFLASTTALLTTSTLNGLYLQIANNLSELTNTSTARTNLGLGSIATHPTTDFVASGTSVTAASGCLTSVTFFGTSATSTNSACSGGTGGNANATGTVGYMAYFNTATGLVSSTLYYQSSTGNFGIGTSSPAQLLTIYASGTGAYAYIQGNGDGSNYSGFELRDNANPTDRWQFVNSQQDGPNNFEFAQNTGGRGWKFPFSITSSTDFIGINTKTPTAQLEVNGTTQLDATTTILGNTTVSSTAATSTFLLGPGTPGCIGMADEISSGTFYYFYWKNGQPFFDTNSCQ